jgi:PhzF family phenazine biosynthesis protein
MRVPLYQVDAFTSEVFRGNPAAVCPLVEWLPDEILQAIAAENNLSETAFLVRRGEVFELRWFTPATEVDLCGHATLAAAHVLTHRLGETADPLVFESRNAGILKVHRRGHRLVLDFPVLPALAEDGPEGGFRAQGKGVAAALGGASKEVLLSRESRSQANYLVAYGTAEEVAALEPDWQALEAFSQVGFIATAPGPGNRVEAPVDFVSRYFAPAFGVREDPVTGSAHCVLAPYWGEKLGKDTLTARQISPRSGELTVHLKGDRVWIEGDAVLYLEGHIHLEGLDADGGEG